jgi:ribose-phosphate pyrophosphokinase
MPVAMKQQTHKVLRVVSGRSSLAFASRVCSELGVPLGTSHIEDFANGEIQVRYGESIRGCDAFIVGTHAEWEGGSINDAILEQLVMVDAAKRASAKRITVVAPFYGYARQDRKASGREPISARLLADLFLAAGAKRLLSVDLHSGQIQGFFDGPVDHLTAMPVLLEYLQTLRIEDLVIVSPDAGRVKVAERYTNLLHADLAIVHKRRQNAKHEVSAKEIVGEVDGRTCVIVDDMIDTGGTIVAAAELLAANGARRVIAATTHPVFSGPAVERLKGSVIDLVVCTDTLPLPAHKQFSKLHVVSVAPIVARAVSAVFEDTSVSEIFGGNNLV